MFINQNSHKNETYFMRLALLQANKVLGNTQENPAVGCVITKNDCVISAGFTSQNGRPHAEVNAIKLANLSLKNTNLYVTLEPCSHYGKTPPCVKSIIKSGIKKVYFSLNDPDIRSYNKCTKIFKSNGIKVKKFILKNQTNFFYRSYVKFKKASLPFVTCKLAVSKDFYTINKKEKWVTNLYSRGRVHLMRSNHDCILTSAKTIIDDNPQLTCRIKGLNKLSPACVIIDRSLSIPIKSKIIQNSNKINTIIFYNESNRKKIKLLKKHKVKLYKISLTDNEINLKEVLIKVKKLGFSRIFVECGIKLTKSFLYEGLVDDFKLFISGKELKKRGDGIIKSFFMRFFKEKKCFVENVNLFDDKLISYKLK
jgi:diaminohydroxyphosphoribosylaminopyrimidine deaminase / 5-amino-6-(5-phosphoribosylamino)uracil reductase